MNPVTISSLEFRNFKAFSHFSVRLQHLNILVGPNARRMLIFGNGCSPCARSIRWNSAGSKAMRAIWKTNGAINSRWPRCASPIFRQTRVTRTNPKPMAFALTCRKASRATNVQRRSSSGRANGNRAVITILTITFGVRDARLLTTLKMPSGSLNSRRRCFEQGDSSRPYRALNLGDMDPGRRLLRRLTPGYSHFGLAALSISVHLGSSGKCHLMLVIFFENDNETTAN